MSMACSGNIFGGGTVLEGQDGLSDHLTSGGANDPGTEHLIGLFATQDLNETFGVVIASCSTVSHEWESSNIILNTLLLQLLLGKSYISNLWVSVNNSWNGIIVDMTTFAKNVLDGSNTLLLSLMGKHWSGHDITDGVNVWNRGLPGFVNGNLAVVSG